MHLVRVAVVTRCRFSLPYISHSLLHWTSSALCFLPSVARAADPFRHSNFH